MRDMRVVECARKYNNFVCRHSFGFDTHANCVEKHGLLDTGCMHKCL